MTDFTIIGGGVIGMMVARELALDGASVELLESGEPGREASWAGGGILSPLHPWRYPDPLLRLAARSQQLFKTMADSLHETTGIDPEWRKCGLLIVDGAEKSDALAWGNRWNMSLQTLNQSALLDCEPALNPTIAEGLYLPEIAQVRNPRMLAALKAHLNLLKVAIRPNTRVEKFSTSGSKITGAITNQGNITINTGIICAGAWGAKLLATTGLQLPLEPVRGQMIVINTPTNTLRRIVLNGARYLIPRKDGRVLIGSTIEHCGFDKQTTASALKDLQAAAIKMAPCLADWPIEHHWAGLRPGSPSGVPYIGPHPSFTNLYSALGHFRNGLMLAPATAELVKTLVTNSPPIVNATDYDHHSFVAGSARQPDRIST